MILGFRPCAWNTPGPWVCPRRRYNGPENVVRSWGAEHTLKLVWYQKTESEKGPRRTTWTNDMDSMNDGEINVKITLKKRVWMGGGGLVFTIHQKFSPLFISLKIWIIH